MGQTTEVLIAGAGVAGLAAAPWLGSAVTAFEVHGWRYAKPAPVSESGCLLLCAWPPLLLSGDALGGPRVEGAALSGWTAADALL